MTPSELLHLLVADAIGNSRSRARVFVERGMGCVGCPMARFETVAEVAAAYHIDALSLAAALAASSHPSSNDADNGGTDARSS